MAFSQAGSTFGSTGSWSPVPLDVASATDWALEVLGTAVSAALPGVAVRLLAAMSVSGDFDGGASILAIFSAMAAFSATLGLLPALTALSANAAAVARSFGAAGFW